MIDSHKGAVAFKNNITLESPNQWTNANPALIGYATRGLLVIVIE